MSSNEFISKNVDEIVKNEELEFPKNMALACAWILGNFKGINLKILDMQKTTSLADYFILASATNMNQASSMADEVSKQMKRQGLKVLSKEGNNGNSDWILIDLGDFIVHIFQDTARDVYDLDNLWEVPHVQIPNEYYYSSDADEVKPEEEKSYF